VVHWRSGPADLAHDSNDDDDDDVAIGDSARIRNKDTTTNSF